MAFGIEGGEGAESEGGDAGREFRSLSTACRVNPGQAVRNDGVEDHGDGDVDDDGDAAAAAAAAVAAAFDGYDPSQ